MVMSRIPEALKYDDTHCLFSLNPDFLPFFLHSLKHCLHQSYIPSCSRTPLFHSLIRTHLCNWNANELWGVRACSSATVWLQWIPAKNKSKMLQQQFICWRHLNYRKQSRFVAAVWEDFNGVNIHSMHIIICICNVLFYCLSEIVKWNIHIFPKCCSAA